MTSDLPSVDVFNVALARLGEEPLQGALTGATKPQRLYMASYTLLRREVLEDAKPDCAKRRVIVAADPTAPPFGPAHRFPLPADYLAMVDLPENYGAQWSIETSDAGGKWLMTDEQGPLDFWIIIDLTDATLFSARFIRAFGTRVAEFLAPAVLQSESRTAAIGAEAADRMARAQSNDSQNTPPHEWDTDICLVARR